MCLHKKASRKGTRTPPASGKPPYALGGDLYGLPESSGEMVIWIITYIFSKQVHFVPCPKIPSVHLLAKLFMQHMYRLQEILKHIISDHGLQFTLQFWQEILKLLCYPRS